jgi:hypothetical protein
MAERTPSLRSQINVPDDREGMLDGHTVAMTSARPGEVFYACRMGLFSSNDRGKSWVSLDVGKFAPYTYARDLRVVPGAPGSIYLALSIASRSDAGALYRSNDAGKTWARADTPVNAVSTIMSMGVHPTDGLGAVYVTRHGQVHWTVDGSNTWLAKQLPGEAGDAYCAIIL